MKFLLLLIAVLVVSGGCSSKKEDCTLNGEKVDCSKMPGRNAQEKDPNGAISVETFARGRFEVRNGKFIALTDFKNQRTKVVGDKAYTCSLEMLKNKQYDFRINERELVLIDEGQEISFERVDLTKIDYNRLEIGKFENMDRDNRMKVIINILNQDTLELTNICYFN